MNQTDLRAELLEKARLFINEMSGTSTLTKLADFALPYAERAAIAEAQLAASQQRVKELGGSILSAYREGHDDATALAIKTIQQHSNDNP